MSELKEAIVLYSSLPVQTEEELATMTDLSDSNNQSNKLSGIKMYTDQMKVINAKLNTYMKNASKKYPILQDMSASEERYDNRVHPEESTAPRELMYGLFPKFRQSSLPYILTAGVFMSLLSIFIVFQMVGITGQVNLPLYITQRFTTPAGTIPLPFYKNPMILGGLVVVLTAALISYIILYYKAKNTNK
jgi:hypothetical protein